MNKVKEFFINYLDIIKTFSGGASVLFGAFLNIDWTKHWLCDGNVAVGIKTLFCEYAIYWFLFFSIALFIISIVEQVKGGSYAKVKQELNLNAVMLFVIAKIAHGKTRKIYFNILPLTKIQPWKQD